MQPEPYTIAVPESDLEQLRSRLRNVRWADDFGNEDWRYGVEREWLTEMVRYWSEEYDWRKTEAAMNRHSHFMVEIEGIPIHFMHIKGKGSNPVPLILSHGWPWTFWDFKAMIDPLADPVAFGGTENDAFDLIIPSLPGFGFSQPLRNRGVTIERIAGIWDTLMTKVLRYPRYAAAGGNFGAGITACLGHAYSDNLLATYVA